MNEYNMSIDWAKNSGMIHDFDPSGIEHPEGCMCPCCDFDDHLDEEEE